MNRRQKHRKKAMSHCKLIQVGKDSYCCPAMAGSGASLTLSLFSAAVSIASESTAYADTDCV